MEWISVKDRLPLEHYQGCSVFGKYLVTVELDNPDPNDDRCVLILEFYKDAENNTKWVNPMTGDYYDSGWNITHWTELPKPPIR